MLSEYNNDISIINELLAIESIMPFNLLTYLLNKLFELKQANVMDDNIEKALLHIVSLPKVFIHINYTDRPNYIDGNYFTVFNSDTILNNGNSTNSNSINWYENYIKSIQIFSEILFPLISKGFFTFIFSIFENREEKIVTAFDNKNSKDNKTIITLKHIKETLEKYLIENKNIIIPPNKTTDKFSRINEKFNEHPDYLDICRKFILNFIVNFTQESLDNYKKIDYNSFSLYKNKNIKACLLDKRIDILTKRIQYYLDNISYDEIDECENNDMIEVIKILFEKYRSIIKNNNDKNKNSNIEIIKSYELTEIIKNIVNHHNEKFRKYNLNKKFENKESDNVNNVKLLLKNLISIRDSVIANNVLKFNHQSKINPLLYDRKMNIVNQYIDYYIFDINDIKKENTEYLNSIAKTIIRGKIKEKKVKDSKKSESKSIQAVDDTTTTKPKKRKFKKNYSKKTRRFYRRNR